MLSLGLRLWNLHNVLSITFLLVKATRKASLNSGEWRNRKRPLSLSVWAAITKYDKLGGLNNNLFLTVMEAGKFKINVPANCFSTESPLPGSENAVSHCVMTWQTG